MNENFPSDSMKPLYSATRESRGETEEMVMEPEEEYAEARAAIAERRRLSPEGAMGKLMDGVRHHVKEEESEAPEAPQGDVAERPGGAR